MEIKLHTKQAVKGDVLCIQMPYYKHFGIYIGDFRVIHYAKSGNDICIHEVPFSNFLEGANYYVVEYFSTERILEEIEDVDSFFDLFLEFFRFGDYIDAAFKESFNGFKIYSAEETIKRARSKLHEKEYNLLFNNCEHFATWCKTGLAKSYQIGDIIGNGMAAAVIPPISLRF